MRSSLTLILLIVVAIVVTSCKTAFQPQVYRFLLTTNFGINVETEDEIKETLLMSNIKGITLKNDSILEYWKRYGGLYSNTAIKYTITNNELIIDSLNMEGFDIQNITGMCFLYSKDSLVNKQTNERYYNQKYLKWTTKKR